MNASPSPAFIESPSETLKPNKLKSLIQIDWSQFAERRNDTSLVEFLIGLDILSFQREGNYILVCKDMDTDRELESFGPTLGSTPLYFTRETYARLFDRATALERMGKRREKTAVWFIRQFFALKHKDFA